ncbi:hypothetical protein PS645_01060 [Pseudomonas fluorescens]|uniref:Uncharacterized protein n=1 Tax=Pseudomonas fluorescens TaxID=294 RepID=A0A5E6QNW5_PSEFL|nr:hypothetical protein PS645_01060 [Pseudomonas fluorescens]
MTGNQQHRQFRVLRMQFAQQLKAIHARHADIANHHPGPVALELRRQALGLGERQDLQPGQIQRLAQRLAQMRIIVDQNDLNAVIDGHALRSSDGCRLTPGAPARNFRVIRAPPSL